MVYIYSTSKHLRSSLKWLTEIEKCEFFVSMEIFEAAVSNAQEDYSLVFDTGCNVGEVSAFISRHQNDRHFTRAVVLSDDDVPGTEPFINGHTLHTAKKHFKTEFHKHWCCLVPDRRPLHAIVGSSKAMQDVRKKIILATKARCNVMVVGESGTGKELVAQAVHRCSSDLEPVVFNCGVLNSSLQMDTLFGHVPESYTGAVSNHKGAIEEADGSSFILDEFESLSLETQSMLLRAVENGEVRRLGENRMRHVSCRYIAVTNREPKELVKEGKLRLDLAMRLTGAYIRIPPLREHIEDLEELVRFKEEQMGVKEHIADIETLKAYSWPGNVRELFSSIERIHREGKALKEKLECNDFGFEGL